MKYKSVLGNEFVVYGLSTELTTSQNENFKIISQHWRKFNSNLQDQKLRQGSHWVKYGITKKIDDRYFYMTAIESMNDLNSLNSLEKDTVNAGEYIRFQHVGSMDRIKLTVRHIYKHIIPSHGIKVNDNRELLHYERYDNRFNWNAKNSIIDIYVPVASGGS